MFSFVSGRSSACFIALRNAYPGRNASQETAKGHGMPPREVHGISEIYTRHKRREDVVKVFRCEGRTPPASRVPVRECKCPRMAAAAGSVPCARRFDEDVTLLVRSRVCAYVGITGGMVTAP